MGGAAAAAGAGEAGAAEAAAGGGGHSPVSLEAKIDLTHGYNRMVDSWFDVWTGDAKAEMPTPACAYPGGLNTAEIQEIRNWGETTRHNLRWHMAVDSWLPGDQMDWDLHAYWEGLTFTGAGGAYNFCENVILSVEMEDAGYGWKLYVKGWTGNPNFHGGIAALPVFFDVKVTDGGGDIKRMSQRGFTIYADGSRERTR